MTTRRRLHAVALGAEDPEQRDHALAAVRAALDGSGPALLPLPAQTIESRRTAAALRPDDSAHPLERDDVALVLPTSGSTGEPKGSLLTAGSLTASAQGTHERLGGPGAWLLALPLTHVAGLQVLVRSVLAGTTPQVQPLAGGFRVQGFILATRALVDGAPLARRYTSLVPTQLARLLGGGAGEALRAYDAVLVGAAAAPPALLARARAQGVRVVRTYGMTETCGGCVYDGRPLRGVSVGTTGDGRVRVRGPVVFAGYRLRPDLTAAALADGWHLTGDLGRVAADGSLEVLGRADDVIVTGGVNVAPAEVVVVLRGQPGVADADVHGRPDPTWGQRVVAVVVPTDPTDPAGAPSLQELRDAVSEQLGAAAAPRALAVVPALPLLATGKPDREALRRLDVEP